MRGKFAGARLCRPRPAAADWKVMGVMGSRSGSDVLRLVCDPAALRYNRNTPNSSRSLALLQGQSLGSSTSFALDGLLSIVGDLSLVFGVPHVGIPVIRFPKPAPPV